MGRRPALLAACLTLVAGTAFADWGWPTSVDEPAGRPAQPGQVRSPDADSDRRAVKLVRRLERAMGGRHAWARTRHVGWDFFGQRQHLWDRETGNLRIESADTTWLMNKHAEGGRVWRNGVELSGPALTEALQEGRLAAKNDGWWMTMPWKLRRSGVHLSLAGVGVTSHGLPADKVRVTFHEDGLAPHPAYVLWLDRKTSLVNRWSYYANEQDAEPTYTGPWRMWGWARYAQFSSDRGKDSRLDPRTWNQVPRSAYESPAPWAMPGKVEDLGSRRAAPPVP